VSWPKDGPPLAWQVKGLGSSYAGVSVAGDRIYTLGANGAVSKVFALERDNGKVVWSADVGPAGGELGCTPTVDGDRVYALVGQEGDLVCLQIKDGKRVWHRNLHKEFGGSIKQWHYCESPLVDGDHVIVTPGGKDATMVALDKKTGETVWKCAIPLEHTEAGYASAVIAEVGGVKQYVRLLDGGLAGVSTDGKPLWTYQKLGPNINVSTPIVLKDQILAVAGYGKGGALLQLTANGKEVKAEEVYFKSELTNKHGGVLVVGDYAYGDTDDHGQPYCAEVKSGHVMWKREGNEGRGRRSASVTYADGRLYFRYANGVVALVKASPDGYKETGSFQVKTDGEAWAHPVVVGGKLYLREQDSLYCYDVREKK
jgi:outer membrane protein assembly factor BamB